MESLENWEVLMTGPAGDAPSLSSCRRSRFREDKNGPLLQRERERRGGVTEVRKTIEKKEQKIPPSILLPASRVGVWRRGLGWVGGDAGGGDAGRVET